MKQTYPPRRKKKGKQMPAQLKRDNDNGQYIAKLAGDEAQKIATYRKRYAQQFTPDNTHRVIVTYTPTSSKTMLHQLIEAAKIQIDLPLEKYHSQDTADAHLSFLYVEDGTARKGHRPSEVPVSGRGLSLYEGLWMIAENSDVLNDHAIDLIADRYSIECIPTLYKWDDQIHLSAVCPDVQDTMCGAPIVKHELKFTAQQWKNSLEQNFQQALPVHALQHQAVPQQASRA